MNRPQRSEPFKLVVVSAGTSDPSSTRLLADRIADRACELAARRDPETAEAPTHASLVKAKYGDQPPRQPRPNANRGDNVTGASPYQDTELQFQAEYPEL